MSRELNYYLEINNFCPHLPKATLPFNTCPSWSTHPAWFKTGFNGFVPARESLRALSAVEMPATWPMEHHAFNIPPDHLFWAKKTSQIRPSIPSFEFLFDHVQPNILTFLKRNQIFLSIFSLEESQFPPMLIGEMYRAGITLVFFKFESTLIVAIYSDMDRSFFGRPFLGTNNLFFWGLDIFPYAYV